ncbi:MAG TPA: aminoglycoside phosphotransferase family protein, partial [Acidimicrobiales bacterium]|nr:aminoglycoside phosphotransferase family protein [Acidimicrobiales bacterium]
DESGGEARAYILEGGYVLKTQRPHRLRPRTSLGKEELFLSELARLGDFPVPRALGHGEAEGIEYLLLTRTPGSPVEQLDLEGGAKAGVLFELGRTLRAIHEVDQSVLGVTEMIPGDRSPSDLRDRFAETFERLVVALEARPDFRDSIDVRALGAARLACTPADTPPVALHSNPGPEHTFADPETGLFTGIIDFGDAYRSHPALDLRPWTDLGDAAHLLAGYRSAGALPDSFGDVWRTGLVIVALARASRGMQTAEETVTAIDAALQSDG